MSHKSYTKIQTGETYNEKLLKEMIKAHNSKNGYLKKSLLQFQESQQSKANVKKPNNIEETNTQKKKHSRINSTGGSLIKNMLSG